MNEDHEVRIETFELEPSQMFLVEAPDAGPDDVGQLHLERKDGVVARVFPADVDGVHMVMILGGDDAFLRSLLDWGFDDMTGFEGRNTLVARVRAGDLYLFLNGFMKS